jgi:hypothetical protein
MMGFYGLTSMGQTRGQIKTTIRQNLDDNGVTFYSDDDLNESFQDAYDDIAIISQCICKNVTLTWIGQLSYYDFVNDFGVSDYLATTAIFNYTTNRWLRDDLTIRDFDRIRRDWELWEGTPQFWASSDPNHIAIAPKYQNAPGAPGAFSLISFSSAFDIGTLGSLGTFKLIYWAQAPVLVSDLNTLLTASDVQNLFEFYVTADMLEQAEEFSKAGEYWEKYYNSLQEYSVRVKRINKSDLLLRV